MNTSTEYKYNVNMTARNAAREFVNFAFADGYTSRDGEHVSNEDIVSFLDSCISDACLDFEPIEREYMQPIDYGYAQNVFEALATGVCVVMERDI